MRKHVRLLMRQLSFNSVNKNSILTSEMFRKELAEEEYTTTERLMLVRHCSYLL